MKNQKSISEAEASIRLQMSAGDPESFQYKIIMEWFDARRAVGIPAYSKGSLVEEIKKLKKVSDDFDV